MSSKVVDGMIACLQNKWFHGYVINDIRLSSR